ncbi:MAG: hypothetical protein HRU20_15070 [Pseudomonadales bacterium]|nr:hypothetical protein [Pseudomonadales bacterium]
MANSGALVFYSAGLEAWLQDEPGRLCRGTLTFFMMDVDTQCLAGHGFHYKRSNHAVTVTG